MMESQDDWTTFEDDRKDVVLDLTNTGLIIINRTPATGQLEWRAPKDYHDWFSQSGVGLISTANCLSDVSGKEDGNIGVRPITWNEIKVVVSR
jgi:hypothetical protein